MTEPEPTVGVGPHPDPWPDDACDQALFDRFHDESNRVCDHATNQTYAEQLLGKAGLAVWPDDGSSDSR